MRQPLLNIGQLAILWRRRWAIARSFALHIIEIGAVVTVILFPTTWVFQQHIQQEIDARLAGEASLLQAEIDETRGELVALGYLLADDASLDAALISADPLALARELGALRVAPRVDNIVVSDPSGAVLAQRSADHRCTDQQHMRELPGFTSLAAGHETAGLVLCSGRFPAIVAFVPKVEREGGNLVAVLALVSHLDAPGLDAIRQRTGLDASLYVGGELLLSTMSDQRGIRTGIGSADPLGGAPETAASQTAYADRETPGGHVRALFAPLVGIDGTPVATLALSAVSDASEPRRIIILAIPILIVFAVLRTAILHVWRTRESAPAMALAAAAGRMRQGDMDTPVPQIADAELAPVATELEQARLRLHAQFHDVVEASGFKEQLVYYVAHELREPLAVLEGALEILATEASDLSTKEFDEVVSTARRTSMRLHTLMDNFLSAGNVESGRFVVSPRRTALAAIVAEAIDSVSLLVEGRNQRIETELPSVRVFVMAHSRYIVQALTNLLINASTYGPVGGVIRVRADQFATGFIRMSVEDTGPGIPPEEWAGLYQRFYRASSSGQQPGVGLGLSIVKAVVEAHGGTVGFETQLGVGSRFWFTLPVSDAG
ncbi:MAG TPA: ATP-binding protein [Chloroflexota bacterium]|nr:ATP-binding protein [Chloroflexota bacterium]